MLCVTNKPYMLSVIMFNVTMLSVVMLIVVAPQKTWNLPDYSHLMVCYNI
jgi:hypothetical protein